MVSLVSSFILSLIFVLSLNSFRINDHDKIDEFANELMHKLNQRNQYPMNTQPFAKSDLHIKDLFRKFTQKVGQLQENLNASANRM